MRERIMCTMEKPWDRVHREDTMVVHDAAQEIPGTQRSDYPRGDTVKKRCTNCGYTWTTELPQ